MVEQVQTIFRKALARMPQVDLQSDAFLLAVSGGKDSVVLADLMQELPVKSAIAHCNFQLRGDASDGDEAFVEHLAAQYQVPFYRKRFDTLAHARETGVSIQMAARTLRYAWLEEVRQADGFAWIVTAHHQQDSIETFLLNFSRGSGLPGLTGIPERNGRILRPMLGLTPQDVEQYYLARNLQHREDASNAETKYARNKIRHEILPVLQALNPGFSQAAARTIDNLLQTQSLWEWAIQYWEQRVMDRTPTDHIRLQPAPIMQQPFGQGLLFELLRFTGANASIVASIWRACLEKNTGAIFLTAEWEILLNRTELLIRPRERNPESFVRIPSRRTSVQLPDGLLMVSDVKQRPDSYSTRPEIATLDAAELVFPMQVRRWRAGDRFQPLGMKGQHKKLKDYFADQKYSRYDKENAWVLVNGDGRICWLVGERLDHRFRIQHQTQMVIDFVFIKNANQTFKS